MRARPLVVHVTTTDISLELLLGPQLRAFAEAGYEIHTASAPGPYVAGLEADGIVHHPLKHSTRSMSLGSDLRAIRELYRLFRQLKPDIVHTHNPKPGIYGRLTAKAARVPLIVNTQHGLYAQRTDSLKRRIPVYALERLAVFASDAELVQNEEDIETLAKLRVPRSKLCLLGNGIDLERFRPPTAEERRAIRAELGWADTDVVVGAVGRLVWEKGYAEFFAAAAQLLPRHENLRIVVIGPDDPGKGDLLTRSDIKRASDAGVEFLGMRADVDRLYRGMDIYVLASHREGFSRSAMEAAGSGLPIVATDIRGCRQVVDDGMTGFLVPPRDARALRNAVEGLVDDPPARTAMGGAAANKAAAEFDQQKVIDSTLSVYRVGVPH